MKKGKFVLAAIAVTVFVCGCSSWNRATTTGANNPCDTQPLGSGDKNAPIVCINYATFDQTGVQPSPNPAHATRSAAAQFWFYNYGTASPALDLTFTFTPVTKQCNGAHCTIVAGPSTPYGTTKYSIIDTSTGRHQDPDILIEP